MIVSFALKNQIIRRTDYNIVVAQSKNYLRARFAALSDDWIGPITAIFNEYTVLLDGNNECLVPWEVLQNPGVVNVSAFCGDLHTASVATMVVKTSGYVDGETPEPPTPGVYAQLTGLVQNAVDTANSVQQRADAGEFNGKDGTDGKDGADGQDGFSPIADVQQTTDGATITITDKTGTTTAAVRNGEDGFSTIAAVEQADDGVVITITDKSGTTTAIAHNGRDGTDGLDAPQIDDTQASPTNPWSGAKTAAELAKKLDTNQGTENAGKVLGVGEDGGVVPVDASSGIDDTKITTANPWSSAKIVETVCPPFEVTGPIVTCNPMAGTPLHVVSQIVPVQEGEGDPSPENVRPIVGWDSAKLWHGGRNLFDISKVENRTGGDYYLLNNGDGTLSIKTPPGDSGVSTRKTLRDFVGDLPDGNYFLTAETTGINRMIYLAGVNAAWIFNRVRNLTSADLDSTVAFYESGQSTSAVISDIQIEPGSQASPYTPYNPASKTITLPFGQTVYGGTLDWNTGVLTIDRVSIILDGLSNRVVLGNLSVQNGYPYLYRVSDYHKSNDFVQACSHYKCILTSDSLSTRVPGVLISVGSFGNGDINIVSDIDTADGMNEYLAQQYSAGKPVQIIYKPAAESTVQLTPQEILALSGTNTIYTDTGDTTISGLADPISIINKLAERIDALESAATNI